MAAVDDILAAVILLIILTVGALVYMMSFARDTQQKFEAKDSVFRDDLHGTTLNNMLKVTEPVSGRNMGVLVADSVYYRNLTPVINNKTVNVSQEMMTLLEMAYGKKPYYLEVTPRIIEVSMNFVIDGSPSLSQERQRLAMQLKTIISRVEAKLNQTNAGHREKSSEVLANVYVLANKNKEQGICGPFKNLSDSRINCRVIDSSDIYLKNQSVNTSSVFINNTDYNLDAFLSHYNMTPPFGTQWAANRTCTNCAQQEDYYTADYGYGTAYASFVNSKMNLARLTILFPVSDELSTSSISTVCFGFTDYNDWITCSLCDDKCPADRSLISINKGVQVALDNNHIINPIISLDCDYQNEYVFTPDTYLTATENSGWNVLDQTPYSRSFGTNPSPTWCSLPTCRGCTDNAGVICFHPNCQSLITEQMQIMADRTGGRVINLEDIGTMDIDITNAINNNIDQYALKIGVKNDSMKRDVIEVSQPLPNGQLVDIRLWVYKQ